MNESVKIPVVIGDKETEDNELEFEYEQENIITVKLDNKEICRCDWSNNLKEAFERMIEIWKVEEKEE